MVHRIVSRVGSAEALDFWAAAARPPRASRTSATAIACASPTPRASATSSPCAPAATRRWSPSTPRSRAELALQGFDGVRAYSARPRAQRRAARAAARRRRAPATTRGSCAASAAAATIAYDAPPAERGRQSAGTVHHVAWGTTVAEHPRWDELLRGAGVPTSGIIDRHYFHSIYFREPSGVLFEIADDGPGFTRRRLQRRAARVGDHPAAAARAAARARSRRSSRRCPIRARLRSPAR